MNTEDSPFMSGLSPFSLWKFCYHAADIYNTWHGAITGSSHRGVFLVLSLLWPLQTRLGQVSRTSNPAGHLGTQSLLLNAGHETRFVQPRSFLTSALSAPDVTKLPDQRSCRFCCWGPDVPPHPWNYLCAHCRLGELCWEWSAGDFSSPEIALSKDYTKAGAEVSCHVDPLWVSYCLGRSFRKK